MRKILTAGLVAVLLAGCGGNRVDPGKRLAQDSADVMERLQASPCVVSFIQRLPRTAREAATLRRLVPIYEQRNPHQYVGVSMSAKHILVVFMDCSHPESARP